MNQSGNSSILVVLDTDAVAQQRTVPPASVWVIVSSAGSIDSGPGDEVRVTADAGTALDWRIVPLNPLASVAFRSFSSSSPDALAQAQFQRRAARIAVPVEGAPHFGVKMEPVAFTSWRTVVVDPDAFPVTIEWGISAGRGKAGSVAELTWKTVVVNAD